MTDDGTVAASLPLPPEEVGRLFTRADGSYLCARWGRPIVPVVFGTDDASLAIIKGAIEAVVALAGHRMAQTDPELGANLMIFFCRDWQELRGLRDLHHLLPDLDALVDRLEAKDAHSYRLFRFDAQGAIRAAFVFLRMDGALEELPADALALSEAAQVMVLWGDRAFETAPVLMQARGLVMLSERVAQVIRAVYDPVLPGVSRDPAHAYRIAARTGATT